jgi:hypothetical protein
MVYYYFFKGFLLPLKEINKIYKEIFFVSVKYKFIISRERKKNIQMV